jgi:hypothetical protein
MNTLDTQLHSFIRDVAQSNLETFHSKAICHVLNLLETEELIAVLTKCEFHTLENQSTFKEWLKKGDIQEHFSVAEVSDHDIITCLRKKNDTEFIFLIWENKIKASFNLYDTNKIWDKTVEEESKKAWKEIPTVTQPTYYQLRWLIEQQTKIPISKSKFIVKIINEIHNRQLNISQERSGSEYKKSIFLLGKNDKVKLDNIKISTACIILSPYDTGIFRTVYQKYWQLTSNENSELKIIHKINAENKDPLIDNLSHLQFINIKDISNQILKTLNVDKSGFIACIYLNYVQKIDTEEKVAKKICQFNKYNEIIKKLKEFCNLKYEWDMSGSSHSGDILLNIIFPTPKITFDKVDDYYSENLKNFENIFSTDRSLKNKSVRWAIQLQGDTCKLQFAINDYEKTKLRKEKINGVPPNEFYTRVIMDPILQYAQINSDDLKIPKRESAVLKIFELEKDSLEMAKENKPKSKSGLSYTIGKNPSIESVISHSRALSQFIAKFEEFYNK